MAEDYQILYEQLKEIDYHLSSILQEEKNLKREVEEFLSIDYHPYLDTEMKEQIENITKIENRLSKDTMFTIAHLR